MISKDLEKSMEKCRDWAEDSYWKAIEKNKTNSKINEAIRELELSRDRINDAIDILKGAKE